jgi:hypothetical protein
VPKGQHKLTNEQVLGIYNDTRKIWVIAVAYKVSPTLVSYIKNGHQYSKLTGHKKPYNDFKDYNRSG